MAVLHGGEPMCPYVHVSIGAAHQRPRCGDGACRRRWSGEAWVAGSAWAFHPAASDAAIGDASIGLEDARVVRLDGRHAHDRYPIGGLGTLERSGLRRGRAVAAWCPWGVSRSRCGPRAGRSTT